MKTFKCEGMKCEGCVAKINQALEKASIEHQVDLASKTVTIEGCANCEKKTVEILKELGFEAVEQ